MTKTGRAVSVRVPTTLGYTPLSTAVSRALNLMDYMARQRGPLRISDLAHHFDLPKSNIHRLLQELSETGFVEQKEDGRYQPTLRLHELGMLVVARHPLRAAAAPFIQLLSQKTRHGSVVAMLDGSDVFHLDRALPVGIMPSLAKLGGRVPVCFVATGQAILAYREDADDLIKRALASTPRAEWIDKSELYGNLEAVRSRGYAATLSGWTSRLNSVAAPILVQQGGATKCVGSVGIMDRDVDFPPDQFEAAAGLLIDAASQIADIYTIV